jgi:hypothetical protein
LLRPPYYYPVYALHLRLLDPGLHANPLIQTPPVFHVEGLHTIQWLMSDPQKLTKTVKGDGQAFALRNHDSGKWIPHLPVPPMPGPFLLETHLSSKYQVIFHQPNVEMDGGSAGIFQWIVAPPWRCFEMKLPLPKFLAQRGRAAALGKRHQELQKLGKARQAASSAADQLEKAEELEDFVERSAVQEGMVEASERAREARDAAQAETAARARKADCDGLARTGLRSAAQHEVEALEQEQRASNALGTQRAAALAAAARQRAAAEAARGGAAAWAEEARKHERDAKAHRKAADSGRQQAELLKKRAEQRARDGRARARRDGKEVKPNNPQKDATGAGNAGVAAPSLLAHLAWPATVELQVSWSQIGRTWVGALVNFAREMLSAYVGFLFDGLPTPTTKLGAFLLDLAKSACSDGLPGFAQKFILEGKVSVQISKKLGPVKVDVRLEKNPTSGEWTWKASTKGSGKLGIVPKAEAEGPLPGSPAKASFKLGETSVYEWKPDAPPVVYGHGIPSVN